MTDSGWSRFSLVGRELYEELTTLNRSRLYQKTTAASDLHTKKNRKG